MAASTEVKPPLASERPPERLCKLPAFRPVALRLLNELGRDDVEIRKVSTLLQSDPACSAEVLTLANSSLFSHTCRIDTVQRAIMAVGIERTRALAASVALQAVLSGVQNARAVQDCWRHCRATAIIAESIAPFYRLPPDASYTAAILHDVGRLGMLAAHPEYPKLLESNVGTTAQLLAKEREAYSVDHCEAGLWLCRIWGLPKEFWEVASQHHAAVTSTPRDRTDLVALSCQFAETLGYAVSHQIEPEPLEALILRIPDSVRPRERFDVKTVVEVLDRELRVQAN
jgi:putative nucleotidyltransferase with HDIG domain